MQKAQLTFDNLFRALAAAGFEPANLVFVDIAFSDLGAFPEVDEVFSVRFEAGRRPARTIYQVAALPFGGQIKVMGVAIKERRSGNAE